MTPSGPQRTLLLLIGLLLFSGLLTACGVVSRTAYPPGSGGAPSSSGSAPSTETVRASPERSAPEAQAADPAPVADSASPSDASASPSDASGSSSDATGSSSDASGSSGKTSSAAPLSDSAVSESGGYSLDYVQQELFRAHDVWRGTPYMLGGSSERGVDCSSFIQIVFDRYFGMNLPRSTREQLREGREVRRSSFQPGDLVFFRTSRRSMHVGILVNQREFLHASTSSGVMISSLDERYWSSRFLEARRVLDEESFLGYSEN